MISANSLGFIDSVTEKVGTEKVGEGFISIQ